MYARTGKGPAGPVDKTDTTSGTEDIAEVKAEKLKSARSSAWILCQVTLTSCCAVSVFAAALCLFFISIVGLNHAPDTDIMNPHVISHLADGTFFLEFSPSSKSIRASRRAKLMEQEGATGFCVVPVPGDFSDARSCHVIALPVAAEAGREVDVLNCKDGYAGSWKESFPSIFGKAVDTDPFEGCETQKARTTTFNDILAIAQPPKVIDYIELWLTHADEMEVLRTFPMDDYCVRAWSIAHKGDQETMMGIRQMFEVAHGCKVRETESEMFVRCHCHKHQHRTQETQETTTSHPMLSKTAAIKQDEHPILSKVATIKQDHMAAAYMNANGKMVAYKKHPVIRKSSAPKEPPRQEKGQKNSHPKHA